MNTYIILAGIVIIITWLAATYNKLVRNKNLIDEGWSTIDVFLKKRYDLISSLIRVVEKYTTYEKSTLENIVQLRSQAMQQSSVEDKAKAESQLNKALNQINVVAERYPELKSNENYLHLQQQMSEVENDLEKARRYYNGTVRDNNITLESFPINIANLLFQFKLGVYFKIEDQDRSLPII